MSLLNKIGATAIGAVSAVALCGLAVADDPQSGGTLIVANEAELGELDPHITCATSSARWVMNHVAEPLVQQDMIDEASIPPPLIPGLAQSWGLCCKPDVGVSQIRTTSVLSSCFCVGQTVL